MKTTLATMMTLIASASSALAASGAEAEGNGLLVTLFLGIGALVVAFQLIPGLALLVAMIRGLFAEKSGDAHH